MKANEYKNIPYDLVKKLIYAYEQKEVLMEGSKGYMQYEKEIEKLKGIIEYIAEDGII